MLGFLLTILTISSWLSIADLGVSSSLRNKLSTLISSNNIKMASIYINSAYIYYLRLLLLGFLSSIILLIIFLYFQPLHIQDFNGMLSGRSIFLSVFFILLGTIINMYFLLNSSISFAMMKPTLKSFVLMIFNIFLALLIIILSNTFNSNILIISFSYFLSALIANTFSSIIIFRDGPKQ